VPETQLAIIPDAVYYCKNGYRGIVQTGKLKPGSYRLYGFARRFLAMLTVSSRAFHCIHGSFQKELWKSMGKFRKEAESMKVTVVTPVRSQNNTPELSGTSIRNIQCERLGPF